MKRIGLVSVALFALAVGVGYWLFPDELLHYTQQAENMAVWLWGSVEANPVPVVLALGTFLLTVVYHKAKGKSLRESLEVAATRVAVVPAPTPTPALEPPREVETLVVLRAKARSTRTQLLTDQVGLQARTKKLPEEIVKAEKNVCYTQQAVTEAKKVLATKHKAHNEAVTVLEALRKEKADADAELAAIDVELKKLAVLV